jgi:hypothetical protein
VDQLQLAVTAEGLGISGQALHTKGSAHDLYSTAGSRASIMQQECLAVLQRSVLPAAAAAAA